MPGDGGLPVGGHPLKKETILVACSMFAAELGILDVGVQTQIFRGAFGAAVIRESGF